MCYNVLGGFPLFHCHIFFGWVIECLNSLPYSLLLDYSILGSLPYPTLPEIEKPLPFRACSGRPCENTLGSRLVCVWWNADTPHLLPLMLTVIKSISSFFPIELYYILHVIACYLKKKNCCGQSAMLSMQYSPIASHQLRRLLSSCDGNNNEGKFTSESEIAVILI